MAKEKKAGQLVKLSDTEVLSQYEMMTEKLKELRRPMDDGISLNIKFQDTLISDVRKVGTLIEIGSAIRGISTAYNAFRKDMDLDEKVVEWNHNGKNAEEWEKIIKKAIVILVNKAEADKIERVLPKLEDKLPQDMKDAIALKEIMKEAESKIE